LLGPAWEVLCAELDLFQATAATILDIAWSPLMFAISDGVGYFCNWWWVDGTAHQVDSWPLEDGVV